MVCVKTSVVSWCRYTIRAICSQTLSTRMCIVNTDFRFFVFKFQNKNKQHKVCIRFRNFSNPYATTRCADFIRSLELRGSQIRGPSNTGFGSGWATRYIGVFVLYRVSQRSIQPKQTLQAFSTLSQILFISVNRLGWFKIYTWRPRRLATFNILSNIEIQSNEVRLFAMRVDH